MGMFDSVELYCHKCQGLMDVQSKSGDCCLDWYQQDSVPADVASGCVGQHVVCGGCGTEYYINATMPRIHLVLREVKKEEE